MKSIEVREQVRLSLAKVMELVLSGLRFRLFRAAITVAIIALAAAFLMTMLSESVISNQAAEAIKRRIAPRKEFLAWVGRLSTPMTRQELLKELAGAQRGGPRWQEFKAFYRRGGADEAALSDEQIQGLRANARRCLEYLKWFAELKEGQRRPLVGRHRKLDIFDRLLDEQRFAQFENDLRNSGSQLDAETFRETLAQWDATRPVRQRILGGHAEAVQAVRRLVGQQRIEQALAEATAEFRQALAELGFVLPAERLETIRQQARLSVNIMKIGDLQRIKDIKTRLAERRGVSDLTKVNARMLFDEVASADGAQWLRGEVERLRARREELDATIKDLQQKTEQARQRVRVATTNVEKSQQAYDRAQEAQEALPAPAELHKQIEAARKRRDEATDAAARQAAEHALAALQSQKQQREEAADRLAKAKAARKEAQMALDRARKGYWDADRNQRVRGYTELKKEYDDVQDELARLKAAEGMLAAFDLPPEAIQRAAAARLEQSRLSEIESSVLQTREEGGFLGFAPRTLWLIVVSFIVCIVGIANAMLMSVTERFREIATMKCLGATDGFIMINFILESMMQGVAGGVLGTMLGALLGLLRSCASFGWTAVANVPAGALLISAGVSLVTGVVVSAVAAVYPAWVAARLAPMEAMRIE